MRITDANGNPVQGASVTWAAAAGGGSVNPGVWAFPVIGTPTRASDHGSGDAQEPAAVVVDCSMHQAPRFHLFPYAVKM